MKHLKKISIISILLVTGCAQKVSTPKVTPLAQFPITQQQTIYQAPTLQKIARPIDAVPDYTITTIEEDQPQYSAYNNFKSTREVITPPLHNLRRNYAHPTSTTLRGAYRSNRKLKRFIGKMVRQHHFNRNELYAIFSTVQRDKKALRLIGAFKKHQSSTGKHSSHSGRSRHHGQWDKYRSNFITQTRINKGVAFWRDNENALNRAYEKYGVDPAYIVGILGVETNFGGYTGTNSVLDALTSIGLEFPRRSDFFMKELENYLLMVRDENIDAQSIKGSYAGAFGLAQFMPSSFRQYAVDFNNDGRINLFDPTDAIGSIANYFIGRGQWDNNIPVTVKTNYRKKRFNGLKTGFRTRYSQQKLRRLGMNPVSDFDGYQGDVSLIRLDRKRNDELWWGTNNFHAIARYNPKDHYAMSVHQLGQAIKKAYLGY